MRQVPNDEPNLQGAHVLVVEDDFLISMELTSVLTAAGAAVIGPSPTVAGALALVDQNEISAAILDVRLGNDTVAPVARGLTRRKIPFLFYTGQANTDPIWREWPASQVISKPARPRSLVAAVAALIGKATGR
jgi:DNA-binding response OmpR family regulator